MSPIYLTTLSLQIISQYPYLFTMNICSLCTNMPTAEGLTTLKYYLKNNAGKIDQPLQRYTI